MWHHNTRSFLIRDEFPDAVARQDDEFVELREVDLADLWRRDHPNLGSSLVAERPRHCQARYVFVQVPHS